MGAKEPMRQKPLLLVDIDGVISLFGFAGAGHDHDHGGPHWAGHHGPADCAYATIDGIPSGVTCTVTEPTTPDGWTLQSIEPASVVIGSSTPSSRSPAFPPDR